MFGFSLFNKICLVFHGRRGLNGTDIFRPTDRERSDNDSDIISGYPVIFRISGYEFGYFYSDIRYGYNMAYMGNILQISDIRLDIRIGHSDIKLG